MNYPINYKFKNEDITIRFPYFLKESFIVLGHRSFILHRLRSKLNTYTVYRENRGRDYVSHCDWTRHRHFVADTDERELPAAFDCRVTVRRIVSVVRRGANVFINYVTPHRSIIRYRLIAFSYRTALDLVGWFVWGHLFGREHFVVPETRKRPDRHHAHLRADFDGTLD